MSDWNNALDEYNKAQRSQAAIDEYTKVWIYLKYIDYPKYCSLATG